MIDDPLILTNSKNDHCYEKWGDITHDRHCVHMSGNAIHSLPLSNTHLFQSIGMTNNRSMAEAHKQQRQ